MNVCRAPPEFKCEIVPRHPEVASIIERERERVLRSSLRGLNVTHSVAFGRARAAITRPDHEHSMEVSPI